MMDRTGGKARSPRKHRLAESLRKGKSARAGSRTRVARVVKGRRAAVPAPANDTVPHPDLVVGAADPSLEPALEPEVLASEMDTPEEAGALLPASSTADIAEVEATGDGEDTEVDSDDTEEDEALEVEVAGAKKKRGDDEPTSFLAMYFRDMAELDVLRPEQEFETARQIEEMELDLWRTLLGFAPGAGWMADTVERAVEKPVVEAKAYRATAEQARRKSSIPARTRFEKAAAHLGAKLRVMDIDRIFLEAALAEIQRVGRATRGLPFEGSVPFPTTTKAFRDYVKTVGSKAFRLKA
ncbi:MAG TPA: hypothetical protein VIY56_06945, partial [Vicinamibacterales bacterium]